MAVECGNSLQICAMRVTLLDSLGNVAAGPDNSYVSDKVIEIGVSPEIQEGAAVELAGGCDCTLGSFKGRNKLLRWNFNVSRGAVEPALISLMASATVIESGADTIGIAWDESDPCGDAETPLALEFWTKHWVDDAQDVTWPYWHHLYPLTLWQIGEQTYNNDFAANLMVGFSRTNTAWGQGPYGDGPGYDIRRGGFWLTADAPPAGYCGFQTATPGS